ncbi:retinol dehydrogenase [Cohnella abietis]|uniref:Retinol dehydrogenase n=2 Tax=Cohnella abietis TaxID=2507935 RepID=A0A3T1DCQ9_9BACL|nr:retinol dehydrogenase [Cohnella abietis]
MKGKVCMVTGANQGMGKAASLELAKLGATVIMVCRNERSGREAQKEIKRQSGNDSVELMIADLASQQSVRSMVQDFDSKFDKLHVLVNNAGGLFADKQSLLNEDGVEMNIAVNHLGSFLLTNLLLDKLIASKSGRIVNFSSMVMSKTLNMKTYKGEETAAPMKMYGQSKLAMIMSGYALVRRLEGTGVTVNALHPGFVKTESAMKSIPKFLRPVIGLFALSPEQGTKTAIYLVTSPELEGVTGKYYVNSKEKPSVPVSYDESKQESVWSYSAKLTGLA